MTKFSSFLILKEMNNETAPRPEGGSGGKSWVVRTVERTKSQCHFCQPQNFTVRSLNKYRVDISEIHRIYSIAVSIFADILLKLTNTVFVFVNLSTNIETRCCLNK